MPPPKDKTITPLAVGPMRAAAMLDVSHDHFDRHIAHELRWIRRGRRKLVPVKELERWVEEQAHLILP